MFTYVRVTGAARRLLAEGGAINTVVATLAATRFMRARVFLRDAAEYRLAAEMSVDDADEAWRRIESDPELTGRPLAAGDVVYIGDQYFELDGDGGWQRIRPGELTIGLYRQIVDATHHDP